MYDKNRYEVTDMRRFVFLLQFVLYGVIFANAQKLIVNVPSQVAVGENFRLTYTVNTQNAKDFHIGNIPDALEVITGPFKSVQASYRMVNGHTTGASSITFTFILCASKKGSYTISPAQITANGKESHQVLRVSGFPESLRTIPALRGCMRKRTTSHVCVMRERL